MTTDIEAIIEAILFYFAEPVSLRKLSEITGVSATEVSAALQNLQTNLESRGIRLVHIHEEYELRTAPNAAHWIEKIRKEELSKDLGRAGLETLAIVLYQGPISRADIDYIRGVNSSFILRALLMRGLIERVPNPKDDRAYLYKGTHELLGYFGVTSMQELPEYEKIIADLSLLKETTTNPEATQSSS
jgi:segregation and condensation protein B